MIALQLPNSDVALQIFHSFAGNTNAHDRAAVREGSPLLPALRPRSAIMHARATAKQMSVPAPGHLS